MITKGSLDALGERVDKFNPLIVGKAEELAESLARFGFAGNVSIVLSVSIIDRTDHSQDALVERKINLNFNR